MSEIKEDNRIKAVKNRSLFKDSGILQTGSELEQGKKRGILSEEIHLTENIRRKG